MRTTSEVLWPLFLTLKKVLCKQIGTYDATSVLETVQDFLIKLDIKPLMHLLEMSPIFVGSVHNFCKFDDDII